MPTHTRTTRHNQAAACGLVVLFFDRPTRATARPARLLAGGTVASDSACTEVGALIKGWLKIHRKYKDCPALGHGNEWSLVGAWVAIIEMAQFAPTTFQGEQIERGEFGFTYRMLQSQWRKSPQKLKAVFDHFKSQGMIEIRTVGKCSILRVINYEEYQRDDSNPSVTEMETDGDQRYRNGNGSVTESETLSVTEMETLKSERFPTGNGNGNAGAFTPISEKEGKEVCGAEVAPPAQKPLANSPPGKKPRQEATSDSFEHFWKLYPARNGRKREKPKALQHWKKLSSNDRSKALKAAPIYAAEEELHKDAFRWLRDKCFDDYLEPRQHNGNGKGRVATAEDIEAAGYTFFDDEDE